MGLFERAEVIIEQAKLEDVANQRHLLTRHRTFANKFELQ